MSVAGRTPIVERDGKPDNGLADLLAGLVEANLTRDPSRAKLLRPARIGIIARDADVGATVVVRGGAVRLLSAIEPPLDVRITADASDLLELTAAPLRLGMPDPFDPAGRRVLMTILRQRVRIDGLMRHPGTVVRLSRLLSPR